VPIKGASEADETSRKNRLHTAVAIGRRCHYILEVRCVGSGRAMERIAGILGEPVTDDGVDYEPRTDEKG
jgi:hypothetical protein